LVKVVKMNPVDENFRHNSLLIYLLDNSSSCRNGLKGLPLAVRACLGFRLALPSLLTGDLEFFKFADEIRRSPFIEKGNHKFRHGVGQNRVASGFVENFPPSEIHP